MYKITAGDAKWQECTMTDEELNEAVDRARQIKMLSTLGLSAADLADLKDVLQQKRGRATSSNDGEETRAKNQKTGEWTFGCFGCSLGRGMSWCDIPTRIAAS